MTAEWWKQEDIPSFIIIEVVVNALSPFAVHDVYHLEEVVLQGTFLPLGQFQNLYFERFT
jgi:hypothetical protein